MKTRAWIAAMLATTAMSAFAALNPGSKAPGFTLEASLAGKAFSCSLSSALKRGPVVVYFYPSAFTNGCNLQAHTFAENVEKFTAAGATIIGVSLDSIERLNAFSADPQYCAGKIPVASDAKGEEARAFDLPITEIPAGKTDTRGIEIGHARTERTTFIVTPDGKIAATIGGLTPQANVEKALEAVQSLHLSSSAKP